MRRERGATVLVTGMSGVGKSAVIRELSLLGYDAVDTDEGDWIHEVDGEPLWREDRIDALLGAPHTGPLFIQGTVANQGRFPFDAVVLLTAPREVILERIATRTSNPFGKDPSERDRILDDLRVVEPILRAHATHVIDTTAPLDEVVRHVLAAARVPPPT